MYTIYTVHVHCTCMWKYENNIFLETTIIIIMEFFIHFVVLSAIGILSRVI